jgi:hypothetical protein
VKYQNHSTYHSKVIAKVTDFGGSQKDNDRMTGKNDRQEKHNMPPMA